jgi:hypothetical protein
MQLQIAKNQKLSSIKTTSIAKENIMLDFFLFFKYILSRKYHFKQRICFFIGSNFLFILDI